MKSFEHFNAGSVDEALARLKDYDGKADLIAGGTDLLGTLKGEILPEYPEVLINIKTIPDLDGIEEDEEGLKIGALAKLFKIAGSAEVRKNYGSLAEAAESVGSPELRHMATLGGNLCQDNRCWYYRYPHKMGGRIICYRKGKGPCLAIKGDNRYHAILGGKICFAVCPSDTAIVLTALDARIRIAAPGGERIVPITEFYDKLGHILKPDEIVTQILIPRPSEDSKQTFLKFRMRDAVDFAVASVASLISESDGVCRDARIVLGAVAPIPYRAGAAEDAIKGKPLNEETAAAAAEAAVTDAKPLSRNAYKIEITKTLVKRAILS